MHNDLQHLTPAPNAASHANPLFASAEAPDARRDGGPSGATALRCAPFASHQWRQNRLLAMLPEATWQRLRPRLELVGLPLGAVLQESGATQHCAYFPTTAIVSLQYGSEDGSSAEIAVIGHEGLVGLGLFMGGGPERAVVRSEGHAYRLEAQTLKHEFDRCPQVMQLLLRYTQTLMTQVAQGAVCNRHHTLDQQLCRWLLGSLDRSTRNSLALTHELIAGALGVRREGVTQAAGRLRRRGLIECSRGRIDILDRHGLEAQVCECYSVVRSETERLFSAPERSAA